MLAVVTPPGPTCANATIGQTSNVHCNTKLVKCRMNDVVLSMGGPQPVVDAVCRSTTTKDQGYVAMRRAAF
ncbi:MAG: hypothetical protein LKM36_14450 [Flavobacteriales bacterium]|jgi:hypothetical protein|nr:hypothetical protein [Flavobacteriales bacterium]